jgi:phosphoribosylaminoimidazolecarboxamide formyltransferase / IMP cyclohydrolase
MKKLISISKEKKESIFPDVSSPTLKKIRDLAKGENNHQKAAFYRNDCEINDPCIVNAKKIQGKELSFNNILDSDYAIEAIKDFEDPTCMIIKHATCCGIASCPNLLQAWKNAYATDVYSPFGGIVIFNRELKENVAEELSKYFLEIVIAPCFSEKSLKIFRDKNKLRLLEVKGLDEKINREKIEYRPVTGGFLVQTRDIQKIETNNWKVVTEKKPTEEDISAMKFAVKCVKNIKSNSIVFIKGTQTVGIGGGQTARVDAVWIAMKKGKENIRGSIMASDAFFPFRDSVDKAAKAKIRAIVQPGGSIRDEEVIKAANEHKLIMVFTGRRYFKH